MQIKKISIIVFIVLVIAVTLAILCKVYEDLPKEVLEKKYAQSPSKFLELEHARVHYRDEGAGPVLVLIHGVFSSLHTWDGWVKELSGKYRIIRLDLPAHGLTGPADFNYTREDYMQLLHGFFEKLNLKKIYLAGNSLGGFLSWSYAVYHPEKIKKLILLDPVGFMRNIPFAVQLYKTPVIGYFAARISPKFIFASITRGVYGNQEKVTPEIIDRYYELALAPGNRRAVRKQIYALNEAISKDHPEMKKITAPTLIMWGDKDSWIPLANSEKFSTRIRNSKRIIYKGAGHVPMEEIPLETARDADRFLSGK